MPTLISCPREDISDNTALDFFRTLLNQSNDKDLFFFQRSQTETIGGKCLESVIALNPFESLEFRNGQGQIKNLQGTTVVNCNPFTLLAERQRFYKIADDKNLRQGVPAALGYFSYDAVRFLEKRLSESEGNLNKINDPKADADGEFRFYRDFYVFNHQEKRLDCVTVSLADCSSNAKGPQEIALGADTAAERLRAMVETFELFSKSQSKPQSEIAIFEDEIPLEDMRSALGREGFLKGVKSLRENIKAGDIFQAVLSDKFSMPFKADALNLFESLCQMSPSPYEFFFSTGKRYFLGASPEMLLKVEGKMLETHPIAGTRPRGKTEQEDSRFEGQLLKSVKEKSEHLMLVDLARNDIGRVSVAGSVRVESYMQIEHFSSVMHLVSKVRGTLKDEVSPIEALASTFPAGTLSGAPKIRAMQLLSQIEPERRGFYGGVVVRAGLDDSLDSCISIRSACVDGGQLILQAGAGIVADSRAEREYQEVQHKTQALRRAIKRVLS